VNEIHLLALPCQSFCSFITEFLTNFINNDTYLRLINILLLETYLEA